MTQNKPQQKILTIWRLLLIAATIPSAFLCSFLLEAGSTLWLLATAAWILLFLFFYLCYLPLRYRGISFAVGGESISLHTGVWIRRVAMLPLGNIQFASVLTNPCDRLFGLCTLRIVAPGARLTIPGLRRQDAEALALLLTDSEVGS